MFIFFIFFYSSSASLSGPILGQIISEDDGFIIQTCTGTTDEVEKALCFFANPQNDCGHFHPASLRLEDPDRVCKESCVPHMDALFRSRRRFTSKKSEIVEHMADELVYANCRYCRPMCWMLNWYYY
jgi:hypothetical protein